MNKKFKALTALFLAIVLVLQIPVNTHADASPTIPSTTKTVEASAQIAALIGSYYVMVNNHTKVLDTPAVLVKNKVFIPLKNAASYIGIGLVWNAKLNAIEMKTAKANLQFNLTKKTISINGKIQPFSNIALLSKGKLMVSLEWFADYTGARQSYNTATKLFRIEIGQPVLLPIAAPSNTQPVAKFTFSKTAYRLGEPIGYVDLSYDPDSEGLQYEWTGKQDVFFYPGNYPVTLKVTDKAGSESAQFTRYVTVEDVMYLTEEQYPVYNQPVGTSFKTDWNWVWYHFTNLPYVKKQVTDDPTRTLLISDSPETIKDSGILYQDTINGKARLYADHMNGTTDKLRFAILFRNPTDQPITVVTTNKGETVPSIYAHLIGHVASVDFLQKDPSYTAPLVVPAGETAVYVKMPDLFPAQGINLIYDVETDGALEVSFVAGAVNTFPTNPLETYSRLAYDGHVRGTFHGSDKRWDIDLANLAEPSRLTIGDGKEDTYLQGYDTERQMDVVGMGNYGVVYKIHADKPRKMAVMLIAKGGPFKGPFLINGQFMMAPASGVISAFKSIQILARTTGKEDSFDIEFTPPAGSAFPIDLIFYPLEDLK
jgi:PKD repeat protein